MRRFLIPLLAVFALPTEINAEDYPHHLDMKNKDRNFLVRTCTSDKKSIDDKKKVCDDSGLFYGDYYIWEVNSYRENTADFNSDFYSERDYPHHLDMTKTDRNYWINVCKGKETFIGKKKVCDSMGLFDDFYYVWDENRYRKANPKEKAMKDFAEIWFCNGLQGREFKVCMKEVIETQQATGKTFGEAILDAIEESEPEEIIIE